MSLQALFLAVSPGGAEGGRTGSLWRKKKLAGHKGQEKTH